MEQSIQFWLKRGLSRVKDNTKRSNLERFWNDYYQSISKSVNLNEARGVKNLYHDKVISLLKEYKDANADDNGNVIQDPEKLYALQLQIENMTMHFDEASIFSSTHNIISQLMGKRMENARDFLRRKLKSDDDIIILNEFGQYTIEALIVYVLCLLFSSSDIQIRVASLVEQLEVNVRTQAKILRKRRGAEDLPSRRSGIKSSLDKRYPIGSLLVELIENRGLITLSSDSSDSVQVTKKKNNSYYLESKLYVLCNFDINILPIKLNLPMIHPPLDWKSALPGYKKARTLSDLRGGYLTSPSIEFYDRYKLLSTKNIHHFYIDIHNPTALCNIMNALQNQAFSINKKWLSYIEKNYGVFVSYGLLMPEFLSYINVNNATSKLRDSYMNDSYIKNNFTFNEMLQGLHKDIQQARYESLIIEMSIAYAGYNFYLPAFLDFRGRIYRSGILHFHERDLARSLIQFADDNNIPAAGGPLTVLATCFHYQSFISKSAAVAWGNDILLHADTNSPISLINLASDAKRPFQFLSNMVIFEQSKDFDSLKCIPITQDASASAYQIMSYFLMDESIARCTNLIPSENGEIQDIYLSILNELKPFIKKELSDSNLSEIICSEITRKMVKGIFMPIIYGKTVMSTASDIKGYLSQYLTHKECFDLAKICFKFWKVRYHNMDCLIRLIRSIGWVASSCGRSVLYNVDYFTTIQDYMQMESINIWVYDKMHKKRRKVSLRVSTDKRDSKKTEVSTFVNFIHQKDAFMAMKVVEAMLYLKAPVYTVHDNFLTLPYFCQKVADIYSKSVISMGPPLLIINQFLYHNVIKPHIDKYYQNSKIYEDECIRTVIPKEKLMFYLKLNIPENTSSSKRKTWDEKINTIVNSYEMYTNLVCGGVYECKNEGWDSHLQKYEYFKDMILNKKLDVPNYSVHY